MAKNQQNNALILTLIVILTITAWNIPNGMYFVYPFTIFSTWIHEMSHGLTSMLFGATFIKLELFSNGSGSACFTYDSLLLGKLGLAAIAGAGPLGPAIVGSIALACSKNNKATEFCLWLFSILLIASIIKWVRPLDSLPFWIMVAFTIAITWLAYKGKPAMRIIVLQILAVQSFVSLYFSVGYLFSESALVAGGNFPSDTQVIENNLFLPHWFWAGLIIIIALTLIYSSIKTVLKK